MERRHPKKDQDNDQGHQRIRERTSDRRSDRESDRGKDRGQRIGDAKDRGHPRGSGREGSGRKDRGHQEGSGTPEDRGHPILARPPPMPWTPRDDRGHSTDDRGHSIFCSPAAAIAGSWIQRNAQLCNCHDQRGSATMCSLVKHGAVLGGAGVVKRAAVADALRAVNASARANRRSHCVASLLAVAIPRSQHCPIAAAFSIRHATAPIARL